MEQTLLLNATYEPLKIVHWQKAITLWCQGKVEIISVYDREVRAVSFSFKLPSVIRLLRFVRIKRQLDYVPFSRANIYARDDHRCQYCGTAAPLGELTFDHVVPAAQGGRKDWENIVTCCIACNRRKGGRTPQQAGMHLIRAPRRPERSPAIRITIGLRHAPESWRDYLYWNVELDDGTDERT
jgi:5-methylcytosine-specific restriction endonuclease McrA